MWDVSLLNSRDKALSTNGIFTHNSDIVIEMIAPEGRESSYRMIKLLKGRNASYGEFLINMKMSPKVDLSECGKSTGSGPAQAKVKTF